jgi:hypothetical protein
VRFPKLYLRVQSLFSDKNCKTLTVKFTVFSYVYAKSGINVSSCSINEKKRYCRSCGLLDGHLIVACSLMCIVDSTKEMEFINEIRILMAYNNISITII